MLTLNASIGNVDQGHNQLCQMLTLNASIGNVDPGHEPTLPNVDPEFKYRQFRLRTRTNFAKC